MGTVGLGYPPQMWLIAQAPSLMPVLPPPPVLGRGADCGERHLTAQNIQSIKTYKALKSSSTDGGDGVLFDDLVANSGIRRSQTADDPKT